MYYKQVSTLVEQAPKQISKPKKDRLTLTTPRHFNPDGTVAVSENDLSWDFDKMNQPGE